MKDYRFCGEFPRVWKGCVFQVFANLNHFVNQTTTMKNSTGVKKSASSVATNYGILLFLSQIWLQANQVASEE